MPHAQMMTEKMRECIRLCLECHAACIETATHCLMLGGAHPEAEHQRLLLDCAQACAVSADFMLRVSPYHSRYCGTCATLCKACGDDCERLAQGDSTMLRCVEICRRCEASCREMSMNAMAAKV
jgi:hypothetical protein